LFIAQCYGEQGLSEKQHKLLEGLKNEEMFSKFPVEAVCEAKATLYTALGAFWLQQKDRTAIAESHFHSAIEFFGIADVNWRQSFYGTCVKMAIAQGLLHINFSEGNLRSMVEFVDKCNTHSGFLAKDLILSLFTLQTKKSYASLYSALQTGLSSLGVLEIRARKQLNQDPNLNNKQKMDKLIQKIFFDKNPFYSFNRCIS